MSHVSKKTFAALVVSLLFCLPRLGFTQEHELYQVLDAWEEQEKELVSNDYIVEFEVSAVNAYQVNTGRHYFCRTKSGEMSWYTGPGPRSAKLARCLNSHYSFALARSNDEPLRIVGFQFNDDTDSKVSETSLQFPTCGASRGFTFIPSMDMTLGGLNEVRDFLIQESVSNGDDYRTVIGFSVDRDKGMQIVTDPIAPKPKGLMTVLSRGLRKGVIVVDSESKRILGLKAEFEFLREPITKQVIQACNSAGQRRADGSLFPLEDAEPEGEMILAKHRLDCRWEYEKGRLQGFEIIDSSEGEFSTALEPYRVSGINYVEREQADQLPDYGIKEPQDSKSNSTGGNQKTDASSSPALPVKEPEKSGLILGFQIFILGLGALALLFSIAVKSSSKSAAAMLFVALGLVPMEHEKLLGQESEVSPGVVSALISEKLVESNYFCREVELVDYQKEELRKMLSWLEGEMGQLIKSQADPRSSSDAEQFKDIRRQVAKKLNECLVPSQQKLIQALVNQRAIIKLRKLEAFELPKVYGENEDSPFSKRELSNVAEACDIAKRKYTQAVLKSMKTSLRTLASELPEEFVRDFELVFEAISQKSDFFKSEYVFEVLDKSAPDNDFDEYEKLCFHNLVNASISSPNTRDLLGVLEHQTEEFRRLISLPYEPSAALVEEREELNRNKADAMRKGDIAELKNLFQRDLRLNTKERESQVRKSIQKVFVPHQIKNIENIAKFKRMQLEFGRNPFDSLASWAKLQDLPADKVREISDKSHDTAEDFENQRKREWDLACKAVEASMKKDSLARFRERFGTFYDFSAELVEKKNGSLSK